MELQSDYPFCLPRGYVDDSGEVHREGCMRLANALDEIEAVDDPRVIENEAYLPVVLLARVVTRLGMLPAVSPKVIAGLFASDLAYLEDLYLRLNSLERVQVQAICPQCSAQFQLQVSPLS